MIKRILVCGGRDFSDTGRVYAVLDRLYREHEFGVLIEGDAPGADRIAGYWARKNGVDNLKFHADWGKHGRAAGPIRNLKMLAEGKPDLVVAFPGGPGTKNMVHLSEQADIPVMIIPAISDGDTP